MEAVAILLALGALIWAGKNRSAIDQLIEKHMQFRRDIERANQRLDRILSELAALRQQVEAKDRVHDDAGMEEPEHTDAPVSPVVVEPIPEVVIPHIDSTPLEAASVHAAVASDEIVPPPPPQPSPRRPDARPLQASRRFDWEALVGVKLFSWIAGIALTFAAVFFLKYSVEHGWLSPSIRLAIGLLTGTALLVACEWKAARRYAVTANALDAAGIAILFSTFFAAHALWNLLGVLPTFGLMAMVTAVAVVLSIRHDSPFIAVLGLVGGFATPILLSTGEDRPIGLFSYLFLLNLGLDWVAYHKRWPYLTALSSVFTTLYQWGWVMKFLGTGNLPLALGIFLVFPILSFSAFVLGERKDAEGKDTDRFRQTFAISLALPHLFAIYLAAVPAYGNRYWLLFGFLFMLDAGLAAIAARRGPEILHTASAVTTVLVFAIWLKTSYVSEAWPAILPITAVFVLLYLGIPHLIRRFGLQFTDAGGKGAYAAPLLLMAFPILVAIEPAAQSPVALFVTLFALMGAIALHAVLQEEGALHFLAAFFALAAEAVWSARYLDPGRLIPALSIYAIFGLFYLGVPEAARRWNKRLRPDGIGAVVLFASLALLFFLATGPVAASSLWGIALLLTILNLGLFQEAVSARQPLLLMTGLLLSWIVIAVWWSTVSLAVLLIPGLVAVTGFALLILGGNLWAARKMESEDPAGATVFGQGLYLGLAGHAFLVFVVLQKTLAVPPWPFLGVLALLDLAIGIAALYSRRGELHLGALAVSQVIVMMWELTVEVEPWPKVAVLSALILAVFGFAWLRLAERLKISTDDPPGVAFLGASVVASGLGFFVLIFAEAVSGTPGVGLLSLASVVFLCLLLAVDWKSQWNMLAPLAVFSSAMVLVVWQATRFEPEYWWYELAFAAAIYVVFLIYPVLLDRRALKRLDPYLAAVLASVPFFFFARHSLIAGGFDKVIGLLPLTQAALMTGLLWNLLRLQRAGERMLGRLALVAGAVLAFVTVAIPLQLEKQWITIGWALQAAALAWLCRKIPHRGLVAWTSGLLAAVFVRLILNPAVFSYHPRSALPIVNWYLYTYLVSAAAFFAAAWFLRHRKDLWPEGVPAGSLAAAGGTVLLFMLVNIEIADFYSQGSTLTFNFDAGLAQDLTYTIGWGIFAFGLLTAGILLGSKPGRMSAIILLSVTVAKCFLHDLWRLGGLYRIGSLVGLAICLTLVALLLQKFVLQPQSET